MMVGTSAGSLNSGFMAAQGPELATIPLLMDAWRSATREVVYPGNLFTIAGRLIDGQDGLFPTEGMRKLIGDHLPPGVTTFGQLKIPCYLTAVDLRGKRLFLFGEDPASSVLDGMMASSVIPVLQPPLEYHGLQLVDGGVLAEVPCSVAMDKGATTIYAINVGGGEEILEPVHGIFNIFMRTLQTWLVESFFVDLQRADAIRTSICIISRSRPSTTCRSTTSARPKSSSQPESRRRKPTWTIRGPARWRRPRRPPGRVSACPVHTIRAAAASVSGITRHETNQPTVQSPNSPVGRCRWGVVVVSC